MRLRTILCGIGLLAGAAVCPARAQEAPPAVPEVVIGGEVVLRIRTGAGGLTAEERADSVRKRLGPILTLEDLSAEDVRVRQRRRGQTASIYVRNRLLMTVDRRLARANRTTPRRLALQWARTLQEVLPRVRVEVRTPGS